MSRTEGGRAGRKQGVDDVPPAHRSKKDTKRWCLGKEGREHTPTWQPKRSWNAADKWLVWTCSQCKRELDFCYPYRVPNPVGSRIGSGGCLRGCQNKHKVQP